MTVEEFIEAGMKKVMPLIEYHGGDDVDIQHARNTFKDCHRRGFSFTDAVHYVKLTEHVNPSLTEISACTSMAEISKKYKFK